MKATFFICGAGGIGRAAALILASHEDLDATIYIGDINTTSLSDATQWIKEGKSKDSSLVYPVSMSPGGLNDEMINALEQSDVILDCLPGSVAPQIAGYALEYECHYVNLTEYVKETNEIIALAKDAKTAFILQTGLAPGYINVLACQLYESFKKNYHSDKVEEIKMRVGALSDHAVAPSYYAYTWSTIGVATEYLKDSIVLDNYKKKAVPSLSDIQDIIINGEHFQDSYTSGGSADLADAFEGKVRHLEYRTLRYPGHYKWARRLIAGMPDHDSSPKRLDEEMRKIIPAVENDRVMIFAHIAGFDDTGVLRGIQQSIEVLPVKVGHKLMRAIQATTASAMCEAAYLALKGKHQGIVLQSMIDPDEFLNGPFVTYVYGKPEKIA